MAQINRDRIAGMNIHYLYYSLPYFLDAQQKLGVKTIELWAGAPHFFLDSMSYSDCTRVRHEVESRGMQVKILTPENCTYQYQFAAQEPELYEKSFAYFANALKAGEELGIETNVSNRVIFMDHGTIVEDRPPKELFEQPEHERTKSFLAKVL